MKKETKKFLVAIALISLFILWTVLVKTVDVECVGPRDSYVGFSSLNVFFHSLVGVHFPLYILTDWLGLVPVFICLGSAVFGLCQAIKRRSILKVDTDILALGVYYIVVAAVFVLFEYLEVNFRPVLIEGRLEASYPSSTTLLVISVMSTADMVLGRRIKSKKIRTFMSILIYAFIIFMILGRVISGVHWITDIFGGVLLGAGLALLYSAFPHVKNSY